ncbi:MAG TPA: hypothetical protein VMT15_05175 [Bryobacteraceae bacterium]|nr:hypothetical protein [Bryobacteraceae bacterium]
MLVFPQLVTGASSLYPLRKTTRQRSVVNTLADGTRDVHADPDAANLGWELHAKGLTGVEWSAIEALFQAASGMWQSFTFLDPAGNLLANSEDFSGPGWTNGALTDLTAGATDPFGTRRATGVTNAGGGAQAVAQTLAAPGNFQYCLSLWACSNSGTSVTLAISTAGASATKTFALGTQWSRVSLAANLGQNTSSVTFGAQLPAGGTIQLFGMQAEAQPGASDYKQTGASGGVYANARFASDTLTVTAQGTDVYDAVIQIVNMESQ